MWQPLAEAAPPVPGREWVPIQAGSLPVDPHGFYQLVLCDGVRAPREQDMHGVFSLILHMQTLAVDVHGVFYLEAVGTVLDSWPEEAPPLNFMHAVLNKAINIVSSLTLGAAMCDWIWWIFFCSQLLCLSCCRFCKQHI